MAWGALLSLGRRADRQEWSRDLLAILGVRVDGSLPVGPGTLVVANHVSWLDVFAINALAPATFVCKREARTWPLLGWLLARNGTLFIRRGYSRELVASVAQVQARLAAGERVAVFPEATTSDGTRLLPFRPALFEAAVRGAHPVVAVALRYSDRAAAFIDRQSLLDSLVSIASAEGLTVRVTLASTLAAGSRREVCARAQAAIQSRLLLGRPAATIAPSTFTPAAINTAEA